MALNGLEPVDVAEARSIGDIVYADVLGQPLVVLNSDKIAMELLDRRSAIYSDRPTMVSFVYSSPRASSGYGQPFVLQPYGDNWRQQRKIAAQDFSQIGIARYNSVQEREARKFVYGVMKDPATLARQLKLRMGTIIIQCTYGHYLKDENDPFLTSPLTAMENFSKSTAPGAWLVDFLPLLQYMPKWMPGASFRSTAAKWRQIVWDTTWEPYLWLKENLVGSAIWTCCISANVFGPGLWERYPSQHHVLHGSRRGGQKPGQEPGRMNGHGATHPPLIFFLAMILTPSVQAQARKELDDFVGRERLLTIQDKASLPYLRSIMAEVLRWHPAVPLGLPDLLSKDDIYEGMHLPKGSLLPNTRCVCDFIRNTSMTNSRYMLHDPEFFPNPDEFNPDRYRNLDSKMDKVTDLIFGFGVPWDLEASHFPHHRRHCARHLRDPARRRCRRKQGDPQYHIFVRDHHIPVRIRHRLAVSISEGA
ncbi:cytochrome P450 [Mycena rosella]|uniref:Cytochrome P450 n=1 Tax=Mycena rosella TaxID=1033263 RepID=A0AAD7CRT7_MYCRO|nr:cytochrome P450 [Mycena rosella]